MRNYFKKTPYLKFLVQKYRLSKNQPDWSFLLKGNNNLWEKALLDSSKGKKILIATSIGSYLPGVIIESLLGIALTLRGADVHVLLCDGALPSCQGCGTNIHSDVKKFIRLGPIKECSDCFNYTNRFYKSLGFPVHRYSELLSSEMIKNAKQLSQSVSRHEVSCMFYDDIAIGEHALAGALRFFAIGDLDGELYSEPVLKRYLEASLLTMFVTTNILQSNNFDVAVFHHGIYVPQGIIGEVCRKYGVRVVNWNVAYRKQCFIFSHHDTYHHTMMTEPIEKWLNIHWNDELETRLMGYLKSRWEGTQDWIWFHEKPEFELEKIADELSIDLNKPCIGLLTSVMWDAVLHYPSNAFPNMLEWVMQTIGYFIKRPDLQLIIRVHPAEIHGMLQSRQRMVDEIKKVYSKLPSNIIIIPPESRISTYAVMSICDTVIIYNTKTGIELTSMGMPVIVAGEAWIRNKGFAMDVSNPEDYFRLLGRLPLKKRMSEEDTIKAKKYAYHFFFRRMIPFKCIEPRSDWPLYNIKLNRIEQLLPGHDAGLDVVCDGILKGADFIYQSEKMK